MTALSHKRETSSPLTQHIATDTAKSKTAGLQAARLAANVIARLPLRTPVPQCILLQYKEAKLNVKLKKSSC